MIVMRRNMRTLWLAAMMAVVMAFGAVAATQANVTGGDTKPTLGVKAKEKTKTKPKPRAPWMKRVDGKLRVEPRSLAWHLNKKWFGRKHWKSLDKLIWKESRWKPFERGQWGKIPNMNDGGSGACGLPQALPCSRIPNPRSVKSQLLWMMRYIKERYGNPTAALFFHYARNWY